MKNLLLLSAALALVGCHSSSYLNDRTTSDRADYGDTRLPVPPTPPAPHVDLINPSPTPGPDMTITEKITGTWTFTVPPTVTRVERKTDTFSQFSLYNGRPAPTDTPFVLITISPETKGVAESDPATYKVTSTREYALNGAVAKEWIGNTTAGAGFCELLIKKPVGNGDLCHALAIAKTQDERKLALEILASLVWKPTQGSMIANEFSIQVADALIPYSYTFTKQSNGSFKCVVASPQ